MEYNREWCHSVGREADVLMSSLRHCYPVWVEKNVAAPWGAAWFVSENLSYTVSWPQSHQRKQHQTANIHLKLLLSGASPSVCVCVCVCVCMCFYVPRLLCMTGRIKQIPIGNACHILLQMDSYLHCDVLFVCVLVFITLWIRKSPTRGHRDGPHKRNHSTCFELRFKQFKLGFKLMQTFTIFQIFFWGLTL